jgi:hypothetical protein
MNKYLFLDIDGVVNSERSVVDIGKLVNAGRVKQDIAAGKTPDPGWCKESIRCLRAAQEAIGFKIVMSSTWRFSLSVRDFHVAFDQYGWDTRGIIIGKTDEDAGCRGDQIKRWLNTHGKFPYHYCIVDDSSDMLDNQMPFFVRTTFTHGLTEQGFEKILEVFGCKNPSLHLTKVTTE